VIVTRDVFSMSSTQIPVGATTSSVVSAYRSKSGIAVDVGLDLARFTTKTFFVKNASPLAPLIGAIEATSVPAEQRTDTDWEVVDASSFAAVLAGTAKSKVFHPDGRRYWRLRMSSTGAGVAVACVSAR
jgi:hypothetical protein